MGIDIEQFDVVGVDLYNLALTGGVSKTLNSAATDADHIPCVMVLNDQGGAVRYVTHDVTGTLRAEMGGHPPLIFDARGNGGGEISPTITGDHQNRITDYTAIVVIIKTDKEMEILQDKTDESLAFTATTGSYMSTGVEQTSTLMARDYKDPTIVARSNSVVRRLTPDECASLQGFPRDWCNIGDWTDSKGKVHKDADSPKYKAYGNSIAVGYDNNASGFWCWLARRICAQYDHPITIASLFDGIGGFPLAFAASGAVPVWASEIEEFPIAVTKKHFPE